MDADAAESLTVDETNALRAKLGLRPLYAASSSASDKVTVVDPRAAAAAAAAAAELAARLDRSRRAREEANAAGRGVVSSAELGQSAADWVASSRSARIVAAADPKPPPRERVSLQPPRAPPAGLRIAHDASAFEEGETVLTLRDAGLLDETATDELINVNVAEGERTDVLLDRKKSSAVSGRDYASAAAAYDSAAPGGGVAGRPRGLPSYYDDEDDDAQRQLRRTGLRIDADGHVKSEAGEAAAEAPRPGTAARDGALVNLSSLVAAPNADYLSKEEVAAAAPARKKKKNIRRVQSDKDETAEGDAIMADSNINIKGDITADLQRQINATAASNAEASVSDHGSRSRIKQQPQLSRVLEAKQKNAAAHEAAGDSAILASAAVAAAAAANAAAPRQRIYERLRALPGTGDDPEDDDDADLQATLARARRLAKTVVDESGTGVGSTNDRAAHQLATALSSLSAPAPAAAGGDAGPALVVFTDTSEFSHLIQARQQQSGSGSAAASSAAAAAAVSAASEATATATAIAAAAASSKALPAAAAAATEPNRKRKLWKEVAAASDARGGSTGAASQWVSLEGGGGDEAAGGEGHDADEDGDEGGEGEEVDDEDGGDDDEGDEGGASSRGVGGIAAALAHFSHVGSLREREEFAGRDNDARPTADADDGAGGVRLEYRDELGRKLTPKEAYRRISYAFHGRDPSKTARDKRMKRMLREQALKGASSTDTPLGSLSAQSKAQEARGVAYLPLGKL
jgi:hypothetical protein